MKITIYRNGNDGGLSIEDGESEADVTRVIMQSAVSFVVSSVPSDLNNHPERGNCSELCKGRRTGNAVGTEP